MANLADIKNQFSSQELVAAFKAQLKKDFEQSNLSADFVEELEPDYYFILERIESQLQHNEKRNDSNVMRLLNRIDISEGQLKRYLAENKKVNRLHVISELIVKRVLQKVVIKQLYKNNKSS
jgi:adenylate kinase family enzyme